MRLPGDVRVGDSVKFRGALPGIGLVTLTGEVEEVDTFERRAAVRPYNGDKMRWVTLTSLQVLNKKSKGA